MKYGKLSYHRVPQFRSASAHETTVDCPSCGKGKLTTRFSCLSTVFHCDRCKTRYTLADLAAVLAEEDFDRLADIVEERLSDRI